MEDISRIQTNLQADLELVELKWDDLVVLKIERKQLQTLRRSLARTMGELTQTLDENNESSRRVQRTRHQARVAELTEALAKPSREYQQYLIVLQKWEGQRKRIIGSIDNPQSIVAMQARLAELENIPTKLNEMRNERLNTAEMVYSKLEEIASLYRNLYKSVQEFIDKHPIVREKLGLRFNARVRESGFAERFLGFIHRGVKGTFAGAEGLSFLSEILEETNFNEKNSVVEFLRRMEACLHRSKGDSKGEEYRLEAQLRKGVSVEELYEYLFGLEYLSPTYTLTLGSKEVGELSPGERGTLLLVFYLLLDDSGTPVILDQPDENLDNETVYELLVPCIRDAKENRQLIIVTHNPNIAIVCDAEQIIHAAIDKTANHQVQYTCGAIESPELNTHGLNVLEGTRPAFRNRDEKYFRD